MDASQFLRIDPVCDEFEAACQAGGRPSVEGFLGRVSQEDQAELLVRLRQVEADYLKSAYDTVLRQALDAGVGEVIVPGYEILGELGRGGMGVVYKAKQLSLKRLVALKMILHAEHADAGARQRFQGEAEVIARLTHPNIVRIHEVGEHGGLPFLSLEFCPGGSLADRLAGTPLEPRTAARLVQALALAVQEAHQAKVVHRDLKPANVLMAADDTPKVADFGLAKHADALDRSVTGVAVGTPSYMSPEQAQSRKDVGAAADVYSLGVILYECLTGRPPFKAATVNETLKQVIEDEPVPPRRFQRNTPRDIETICLQCLRKEPANRYASAEALAEDLRRFQAGEPIAARPVGVSERAWRWCRRKPAVAGLLAAVVALLLVVVVGTLLSVWRLGLEADRARTAEHQANQRLLEASVAQAEASRSSLQPGRRFDSWEALAQAARIAQSLPRDDARMRQLRNAAIACLTLPDMRLEQKWERNPPGTNGLAFDSRLERYAWSSNDGSLRIRRVREDEEICSLRLLAAEDQPDVWVTLLFSPGGRFLAVWHDRQMSKRPLEVWDLKAPAPEQPCLTLEDVIAFPAFSADDSTLAVALPGGSIELCDPIGGQKKKSIATVWPPVQLQFSPDGKLLAVASEDKDNRAKNGVQVCDLSSGKVELLSHPLSVKAVAWQPGGRLLAAGCTDHHIYLWDTQNWKQKAKLEGHYWDVVNLTFDQDGGSLLSYGWDMTMRLWDVETQRELVTLRDVRVLSFGGGKEGLRAAVMTGSRSNSATVSEARNAGYCTVRKTASTTWRSARTAAGWRPPT